MLNASDARIVDIPTPGSPSLAPLARSPLHVIHMMEAPTPYWIQCVLIPAVQVTRLSPHSSNIPFIRAIVAMDSVHSLHLV